MGHDSSAVLIEDGVIIGAVQEERFTRQKNFSGYPQYSIEFLLNLRNLKPFNIQHIAFSGENLEKEIPKDILLFRFGKIKNKLLYYFKLILFGLTKSIMFKKRIYSIESKEIIKKEIQKKDFINANVTFYDHHFCHAASAFYSSPYKNAIIITQDGKGDGLSGSIYLGHNDKLEKFYSQPDFDSIGQIYSAVTEILGYKPNRHEGKITGLAAFGNKNKTLSIFNKLIEYKNDFFYRENKNIFSNISTEELNFKDFVSLYSNHDFTLDYELNNKKLKTFLINELKKFSKEDIAAGLQTFVENVMLKFCKNSVKLAKNKLKKNNFYLCLAGGLFANVRINQLLRELSNIKNIYVQPAMGDAGLSLGAAQLEWTRLNEKNKCLKLENVYLGPSFSEDQILKNLRDYSKLFKWQKYNNIENKIADLLAKGVVVGRFNGKVEWGPRALGNRSILISPKDKKINEIMNKRLKRTEFMPFAPCTLDIRAKDYFINYKNTDVSAQFMTATYHVNPNKIQEIDAVVHIDNTARPQIVTRENNSSLYKILTYFNKLTGIGCLVNTSFNLHEEPIVNNPDDALRSLMQGAVDVLAIENFLVTPIK